ncbi:type VI secretion system baseplate subunit TssE [Fluviispira multicolorata]|uniref:Type VI secretion system baseplate subunit TssE n=1 Tax=Fluviispira multicolorata TaxID=2654512 RepID=A0A833JE64_9BACT|nr:type VI secretion system baseplate subunit TssE [Fluviispira multicolorata]KAB8031907.1 type VI secretion system baseplate subunit TssE [Fluviispira multicolorata]
MSYLNSLFYISPIEDQKGSDFNSITRNIYNILNTRSSLSVSEFLENQILNTLHFGVPSFSHFAMDSENDRDLLCQIVQKSLRIFENRLSYVDVEFSLYDRLKKEAKLSINAVYQKGNVKVNLLLRVALWEFIINDWQV